jgi:hypothetical protein
MQAKPVPKFKPLFLLINLIKISDERHRDGAQLLLTLEYGALSVPGRDRA